MVSPPWNTVLDKSILQVEEGRFCLRFYVIGQTGLLLIAAHAFRYRLILALFMHSGVVHMILILYLQVGKVGFHIVLIDIIMRNFHQFGY